MPHTGKLIDKGWRKNILSSVWSNVSSMLYHTAIDIHTICNIQVFHKKALVHNTLFPTSSEQKQPQSNASYMINEFYFSFPPYRKCTLTAYSIWMNYWVLEISLEKQNSKKCVLVLCVLSVDEYRLYVSFCCWHTYHWTWCITNSYTDITITYGHIIR